jgi:recombination protein RecA
MAKIIKNIEDKEKDILSVINDSFGKGTILQLNDESIIEHDFWPSGLCSVDYIMGGGLPKGRMVELYGHEGTGKTTLALQIAKSVLNICDTNKVVYIDTESSLNYEYCKKIGINFNKFFICQTQVAEEVLNIIKKIIENKLANLIIVDSVASLIPESEIDNINDFGIASLARILSSSLRKLSKILSDTQSTILFINQLRSNVTLFGSSVNDITCGGKSLKYYSSLRIEMTSSTKLKDTNNNIYGVSVNIKTTKNKFFPPFRVKTIELYYGTGFDPRVDFLNYCIENEVIIRNGSWYSIESENVAKGKEAILLLLNNPKLIEQLNLKIMQKININKNDILNNNNIEIIT